MVMRLSRRWGIAGVALAIALLPCAARDASAANYYWDTTTTGLWTDGANWSNNAVSGGVSGTVPADSRTADVAFFNQSSVNGSTTVELNAARSILGMTFLNTGSTLIRASASGTQTLTVGDRGITMNAGAGPVTIGDATNALRLVVQGNTTSGSFQNNSSSLLHFINGVNVAAYGLNITGTGTGGVQIDGGLSGAQAITKSGNFNLTLTGSNALSAAITLSGGTMAITGVGTLGSGTYFTGGAVTPLYSGAIALSNSSAFVYSSSANSALEGLISGTGSLTMAGSGMLSFVGSAANTYTGRTTISSGTLMLGPNLFSSQNATLGTGDVVNNGTLIFNTVLNGTTASVISGTGTIIKTGGKSNNSIYSTQTLTGSNTFTGSVVIQAGGIALNFAGAGSPATNILAPASSVAMGSNVGAAVPVLAYARDTYALTRPRVTTNFTVTGSAGLANTQSIAGLSINDGIAQVGVTAPAASSMTLDMGSLSWSAGSRGVVNFTPSATGTVSLFTTSTNTNGIIGPRAIVTTGSTGAFMGWASSAASGGTSGLLTTLSTYTTNTFAAGANTNVTANATVPAGSVTNSLRFGAASTLTLAGTTTITSGGILYGGAYASNITGGVLRGSPTEGLVLAGAGVAYGRNSIASTIVDTGAATGLTYAPLNIGFNYGLTLSGNNTYTGKSLLMGSVAVASVQTGTSGPLGVGGTIEMPADGNEVAGRLVYTALNSFDYSPRFSSAANQAYAVEVPSLQTVTFAASFGSSSASLFKAGGGNLVLTGSNNFVNGVSSDGDNGYVTLGSANAVGTVGGISLGAGQFLAGAGPILRFTAASAGLDLGSRLSAGSGQGLNINTNGQNVTFQTTTAASSWLNKMGDGQLTFSGTLTGNGLVVIGGTLALNSANLATVYTSAGYVEGKGFSTFRYVGASGTTRTQTVSGLNLAAGLLTVAVDNPGTSTTLNVSGSITRAASAVGGSNQLGTVDFRAINGTFGTTAIVKTSTGQALTNGILGAWATVDGTDWATHTSGTIQAYTGYTDVASDTIADGATANARIASTTTGTVTLGASTVTLNTLLQSATSAATISIPSQTLLTGGVMVGRTAAALTIGDTPGSGSLQPATAGGEIVLSNFGSGTLTVNSVIANNTSASRLTISGNGTIALTGSNTLTGTTAIQGGTLRIGNGGTTGSLASAGSVFLSAGATLVFDRTDDYGGAVTYRILGDKFGQGNSGGLVVRGGNLTLQPSSANTYQGFTQLLGGTVTVASASAFSNVAGSPGAITFGGGVLRYGSGITDDFSARVASSTSAIIVDTNGQSPTWAYSVVASNTAGFEKRGTGTLTFGNVNSYLGTTTITAGALKGAAQSFPGNIVNSSTLAFSNDTLNVAGVYAGVISGAGVVLMDGTSANVVTLTGTSTFATVPVIQQGRLDIGWSAAAGQPSPLGTSGTVNVGTTGAGGLLGYSGASDVTFTRTVNLAGTTIGGGLAADGAGAFVVTGIVTATGAGSKTFTLTGSSTAANEVRGVISNNSGSNLTSLAKTGDGVWWVTGTNTFTGSTSITAGTLVVSQLTGTGVAGPLGAATSAIQLGSTTVPAALRYTGTGHSTNRGITLTGTGTLEAAGPGAMTVTGTVTGVAGSAVTLLLTGTSMAANAMGMITEAADPAVTSVTKDGPGLWRLTSAASDFSGPFTVKNGTVVAAASAGASGVAGAFGSGGAPIVGDTAAGATGTAALLAEAGVTIRGVKVAAAGAGSTQAVLIGGASTTGTAIFASNPSLALGRSVSLVAATGGAASFANGWLDAAESGIPSVDVAIGAPGYLGTVRLLTSGTLATTGSVSVRYGTAVLGATTILDGAGTVAIDSGATLTGIGTVAAPLGGAGLVAPGNSPGILTAEGFDPALGLAAAFEFTGTAPDYTSASASVNDVLRLTGTTPFTAGLTASNVVSIYLSGSGNLGDVFEGGFFTDSTSAAFTNFQTLVASGSFVGYYQSGTGAYSYNGQNYALLSDLNRQLQVGVTTVPSAGFVSGSSTVINGQVTTFTVVVPEPATLVLAAMGIGLAARSLRRRRLAAATKMVPIAKIR